jgi:hypothetical protein
MGTINTVLTSVYCLLTLLILVIGSRQLKSFRRSNNAQFLHNLFIALFNEKTVDLITIIHSDSIRFDINNNYPVFRVDIKKLSTVFPERKWHEKEYYTTYEMDLFLLNTLDSVGSHVTNKVIDFESAHQYFSWYLSVVCNNGAIKNYLKWIKEYEKTEFVFIRMSNLHLQFEEYNSVGN